MNALLADDEIGTREAMLVLLEQEGLLVDCAGNAGEAAMRVREKRYDFVFVGFLDPERDAVGFLRSVRLPRDTKVLFLTRVCNRHTIYRLFKMGIRGYLPVPCDGESLRRHLAFHRPGGGMPSGAPLPETAP